MTYLYIPAAGGAVPMGIDKVGNQTPASTRAYNVVTGWTARLPGYPETVPSGNGMALKAGTYNVAVQLTFDDRNNEVTVQLRRAGVVVATGSLVSIGTSKIGTWSFSNVVWPNDGDVLDIQMRPKYKAAIVGGAGTYVTAIPV